MTSLWLGSLPFTATEQDVRDLFAAARIDLLSLKIIYDRETGRSKGYGYIDVADRNVDRAMALDGTRVLGRSIAVQRVREKAT